MRCWRVVVSSLGWLFVACAPVVIEAFEPAPTGDAGCANASGDGGSAQCGCGASDEDFDGDGAVDCLDECPDNAGAVTPAGPCGCSSFEDEAACSELRAAVRHRYTFAGTGTTIVDFQSGADATLLHTDDGVSPAELEQLQTAGRLAFDGAGSYVDLPDGMISSLESATFEAWILWGGDELWTRIFDFGSNDGAVPADGVSYLFLTPSTATTGTLRVAYSIAGPTAETRVDAPSPLPAVSAAPRTPQHVAVVMDAARASMQLYVNGAQVSSVPLSSGLEAIDDVNNWLGRSNYEVDPPLSGTLLEFRIYARALADSLVAASFQAGPGALD